MMGCAGCTLSPRSRGEYLGNGDSLCPFVKPLAASPHSQLLAPSLSLSLSKVHFALKKTKKAKTLLFWSLWGSWFFSLSRFLPHTDFQVQGDGSNYVAVGLVHVPMSGCRIPSVWGRIRFFGAADVIWWVHAEKNHSSFNDFGFLHKQCFKLQNFIDASAVLLKLGSFFF